jgi:hypothetical protein
MNDTLLLIACISTSLITLFINSLIAHLIFEGRMGNFARRLKRLETKAKGIEVKFFDDKDDVQWR